MPISRASLANFIGHTLLLLLLLFVAVLLIRHYFYGENGYYAAQKLQSELQAQRHQNAEQYQKNTRLLADVNDLKTGVVAIEEHARVDLGFVKPDELFIQLSTAMPVHGGGAPVSTEPDAVEVLDVDDIL